MSEKPHTSRPANAGPARPPSGWAGWSFLTLVLWLIVTAGVIFSGTRATAWMDRLAAADPDKTRQREQTALRVTRALLQTPPPPATARAWPGIPAPTVETLWAARLGGTESGFYLAGALINEWRGQSALAAAWLGLNELAAGRPALARVWQAQAPPGFPWPPPEQRLDPAWLDRPTGAGRLLKASLAALATASQPAATK